MLTYVLLFFTCCYYKCIPNKKTIFKRHKKLLLSKIQLFFYCLFVFDFVLFWFYTAVFTFDELDLRSTILYFNDVRWLQTTERQTFVFIMYFVTYRRPFRSKDFCSDLREWNKAKSKGTRSGLYVDGVLKISFFQSLNLWFQL